MVELSIITVCYNSEKTISETIRSIKSQTFKNYEYIIIDGNSIDNTVQIARESLVNLKNMKIVSEPDHGIYDAMNKGIELSTGKIICILNSDNQFFNEEVLQIIIDKFNEKNLDILYGNTLLLNEKNKIIRNIRPGRFRKGSFSSGWFPAHPSTFVSKEVYKKIGSFKIDLKIAADFDFLLRSFELNEFNILYINEPLVKMMTGGTSTGTIKNIFKGINECKKAFDLNNTPKSPFYSLLRIYKIIRQYISTALNKKSRNVQ